MDRVPAKGERVTIPKGTIIFGTFDDGIKEAKRTYKVTVHHILRGHPGLCYCKDDGKLTSPQEWRHREGGHGRHCVPSQPTMVCWAGAGGYWHEAALEDVEEA